MRRHSETGLSCDGIEQPNAAAQGRRLVRVKGNLEVRVAEADLLVDDGVAEEEDGGAGAAGDAEDDRAGGVPGRVTRRGDAREDLVSEFEQCDVRPELQCAGLSVGCQWAVCRWTCHIRVGVGSGWDPRSSAKQGIATLWRKRGDDVRMRALHWSAWC